MCGILFASLRSINKEKFLQALKLMVHRGPDASLCYKEFNRYKLGHNRLSIIDLQSRSNQPFFSQDERYVIIYNGEVYNYKELAKKYSILLKTNSDTELIIELSIKIGFKDALEQFNGMFAYIIYDTKTDEYFIARDRLGVKPLYIYELNGDIVVSSEINAILHLLDSQAKIDDVGLRQYKKLRAFFNGHTIYKNIKMFPAGCYQESKKIKSYWELPIGYQSPPTDDELRWLIESSVEYRKVSDVPLGSYLSGGLDSTIVAALTSEAHTWTVGFKDQNEFEWGQIAAEKIGSTHHEIIVDEEMFINDAAFLINQRKEPLSVPNEVLLYQMTKAVKQKNKVVLCGEGADELFFGYDRIFRWANAISIFNLKDFSKLYSYGSVDDYEIVESVIEPYYAYGKPIDVIAAFFQMAHLHGLLRRLDNSTMMCSVEARAPFVDYRLVERMAGVPFEYRMPNDIVKAPLKRIFKDIIPPQIIIRKKVGFPVKLENIFHVEKERAFDSWFDFNINELRLGEK